MKDKKILIIIIAVAILSLFLGYIFYFQKEKAEEIEFIEEKNIEEARVVFLEIEQSFYNIVEKIFLRQAEATKILEEDIVEIQKNLDIVERQLDEGVQDKEKMREHLVLIKTQIESLTEKLIELDS